MWGGAACGVSRVGSDRAAHLLDVMRETSLRSSRAIRMDQTSRGRTIKKLDGLLKVGRGFVGAGGGSDLLDHRLQARSDRFAADATCLALAEALLG